MPYEKRMKGLAVIKAMLEQPETPAGRRFALVIQALIVFSLISFSIETLPNLSPETRQWLRIAEIVTVAIFTIEYVLRVAVADRRLGFVFSFYGIIDLAAIVPFYVTTGLDLRSLRAFRLLRLFRIFKLLRYQHAIETYRQAFKDIREELILFTAVTALLLFLSAVGIYYFESEVQPEAFGSVFHCLWWAVATLTTVGYGDVYPITVGGRIFTAFMLFLSLGCVAVPAGLVASALTTAAKNK